ncbi:uncharacterized protein [Dysidea avara]|uniref:uncharacterized protein n=1 Tax=Dysidea avara TaxID=196820 RepID=UPI003320EEF4
MAEDFERSKQKRRGYRGVTTRFMKEMKALLSEETIEDGKLRRLRVLCGLLWDKQQTLKALDELILGLCSTEDIEQDISEADEISAGITEVISECEHYLEINKARRDNVNQKSSRETTTAGEPPTVHVDDTVESSMPPMEQVSNAVAEQHNKKAKPKLPRLVLPRFSGDVTKFRSFWDSFKSAVDENNDLSVVDKFNYLQSLLEGPAAKSIQGLPLTAANYDCAKQVLEERFGRMKQIIAAHMDDFLKIQACGGDKTSHLRAVYDKIHINVRGLESIGVTADQYGSFLIPIIMSKLPSEVRLQVARVTARDEWDIQELLAVIKAEVEAREISDTIKITERKPVDNYVNRRFNPPSAATLASQFRHGNSLGPKCAFCKEGHYSASCSKVQDVHVRKDTLRREGRCFVCLSVGHKVSQCTSSRRCRHCNRRHHQAICDTQPNQHSQDSQSPQPMVPPIGNTVDEPIQTSQNVATTSNATRSKVDVLLQTAKAWAHGDNGQRIPVRVMLDGGSQRSYITNDLKTKLGLKAVQVETIHLNTFGSDSYEKKRCDLVEVVLQGRRGESVCIQVIGFPKICSPLSTKVDVSHLTELQGFELADHDPSSEGGKIDVLIGSDYYWEVVSGEIVRDVAGPVAMDSKFGWVLSGPVRTRGRIQGFTTTSLVLQGSNAIDPLDPSHSIVNLNDELRRFWETEAIGIIDNPDRSELDSQFIPSMVFDENQGRYEVCLPWKANCKPSATNYNICLCRLQHLRSHLKMNRVLAQEYADTFSRQVNSGIIERVPLEQDPTTDVFFLPHHGVVRADKETTKLRIVFDGSAHDHNSCSLNDCLEKGPNLTPHVFDILVKFRTYRTGLSADIDKAFHQIAIDTRDRDMLRFLWFDDVNKDHPNIIQYRFCRLVFRLTSSPAILNSVLRHHLTQGKGNESPVNRLLEESLYVDDFVGGAVNDEEAFELYQKAQEVMKTAGFNLRKWNTNSPTLRAKIKNELRNFGEQHAAAELKILGLSWNTDSDELYVDVTELMMYMSTLAPTKKSVLKFSAKLFDPLGFLGPFTVKQKILFQSLCSDKVNWDEPLDGDALKAWGRMPADLKAISRVRVQRCYFRESQRVISCQLHGFSDASERALAAVVYVRIEYEGQKPEITLVTSKTRVALIKRQTISTFGTTRSNHFGSSDVYR